MSDHKISIVFDQSGDKHIYKRGETISGKVNLTLHKTTVISEVKISFSGRAHSSWEKKAFSGNSTTTIFDQKITVWPNGPVCDPVAFPAGQHVFDFSFLVPFQTEKGHPLPSSLSSDIYYLVNASIRGLPSGQQRTCEFITIPEYYELDTQPQTSKGSASGGFYLTPDHKITIFLDRPGDKPAYKCGEVVSGTLNLILKETMDIKEVSVSFTGEASIRDTGRNDSSSEKILDYDGSLHEQRITVWPPGGPIRDLSMAYPVGQYVFDFSFLIPTQTKKGRPLPSTINDSTTNNCDENPLMVSYWIDAYINGPTIFIAIKKKITVLGNNDWRTEPPASLPMDVSGGKTFCCWCCASGRIGVLIKLPRIGYCVGDYLGVQVEIINHSRKTVKEVRVRLIRCVCSLIPVEIAKVIKTRPLLPGQTQQWVEGFEVPKTRPTTRRGVCQVTYHVAVQVVPRGWSNSFTVKAPIIIGKAPSATLTPVNVARPLRTVTDK